MENKMRFYRKKKGNCSEYFELSATVGMNVMTLHNGKDSVLCIPEETAQFLRKYHNF